MQVLQTNPVSGWNWVRNGYALFRKNPMIWMAIFFAYLLITLSLYFFIPLIGLILFYLIDPIFVAGFMIACKAVDADQELEIAHLFSAFKQKASRLVTVGGINLVSRIVIFGIIGLFFVNSGFDVFLDRIEKGDYEWLLSSGVEIHFLLWLLSMVALMLPLYMAYWFAPVLVEFDEIEPFEAIHLSFKACLRNTKAFLMFGLSSLAVIMVFFILVSIIGAVLGLITMLLGNTVLIKIVVGSIGLILALLCWIGVQVLIATTQYASYKDIFRSPQESDGLMAL
jgi:hypothetical protein